MGNHNSNGNSGRVLLPDGTVQEYNKPITVAELMLDHPQQVVVDFQTVTNSKKPKPLPADTKLETNKVYMMLPMRRGQSVSSEEARRILLRANLVLSNKSFVSAYTGFLPLFARICPAVVVKGKKVKVEEKSLVVSKSGLFWEMDLESEERPDFYLSRQTSGKLGLWKPSLDTIKEKGVKAKIRHWLH